MSSEKEYNPHLERILHNAENNTSSADFLLWVDEILTTGELTRAEAIEIVAKLDIISESEEDSELRNKAEDFKFYIKSHYPELDE